MRSTMFAPKDGGTFVIANAVASAAGVQIPTNADAILLTNSSTTAMAFFRVTRYLEATDVGSGTAAVATTDTPVPPLTQAVIFVGHGLKSIRAIASAADGNLYVTPGNAV